MILAAVIYLLRKIFPWIIINILLFWAFLERFAITSTLILAHASPASASASRLYFAASMIFDDDFDASYII